MRPSPALYALLCLASIVLFMVLMPQSDVPEAALVLSGLSIFVNGGLAIYYGSRASDRVEDFTIPSLRHKED